MLPGKLPMPVERARMIALGTKGGALGEPSKMPGFAFGLSAFECKRAGQFLLNPKASCAHCYARTNWYATWWPVVEAHKKRMENLRHPQWVPAMVTLIMFQVEPEVPYFRWHDSGDLQGVWHLWNIVEVCTQTPMVHYWMPTHEPFMVREYLELVKQGKAPAIPKNLCIRVSADFIDKAPERIDGLEGIPTSTINRIHGNPFVVQVSENRRDSIECKSYKRALKPRVAGLCGNCRACWDPRVKNISYPLHGEKKPGKWQLPLFQE